MLKKTAFAAALVGAAIIMTQPAGAAEYSAVDAVAPAVLSGQATHAMVLEAKVFHKGFGHRGFRRNRGFGFKNGFGVRRGFGKKKFAGKGFGHKDFGHGRRHGKGFGHGRFNHGKSFGGKVFFFK